MVGLVLKLRFERIQTPSFEELFFKRSDIWVICTESPMLGEDPKENIDQRIVTSSSFCFGVDPKEHRFGPVPYGIFDGPLQQLVADLRQEELQSVALLPSSHDPLVGHRKAQDFEQH